VEKADTGYPFAVKAFSKECVYSQDKGKVIDFFSFFSFFQRSSFL